MQQKISPEPETEANISNITPQQNIAQPEGEGLSLQERVAYFREKYGSNKQQNQTKQWEKTR